MPNSNRSTPLAELFVNPPSRAKLPNTKWDRYRGQDILPMWIADMEFQSPPAIIEALHKQVEHGIFGYQDQPHNALLDIIINRLQSEYGWLIKPEWLVWTQGMVPLMNAVARQVLSDGGQSMTWTPTYFHLFEDVEYWIDNPADSLRVPLIYRPEADSDDVWTVDWSLMDEMVTERTKLFMLCNPHNPVGKVYRRETLERLAEFCERHDLIICSDEIHCDLLYGSAEHIPIASLSERIAQRTITLMAPSKTFNIAGLGCSFAIVPDADIRAGLEKARKGIVPTPSVLGFYAAEAGYRNGSAWLSELLSVLQTNIQMIQQRIGQLPGVRVTPLSATFLAWIEVTDLQLDNPQAYFEEQGLGLQGGDLFGQVAGRQFLRMNFACPTSMIEIACERFESGVQKLG